MPDKATLWKEINEASFAMNDINLYLDTHPTDKAALDYFHKCVKMRKQAMQEFESHYYPLTVDCIRPENEKTANAETKYGGSDHFTWVDGPLPWEGEC